MEAVNTRTPSERVESGFADVSARPERTECLNFGATYPYRVTAEDLARMGAPGAGKAANR